MDIHRTGKVADWYTVPKAERTVWQRIASATHGLVTLGNLVSVVGATITITGFVWLYEGRLTAGLIAIAIGRFCDILDGYAAQYTATKSSLGEGLDAGLDKLAMLVAFFVFISTDIVPLLLIVLLAAQQLAAIVLSVYARLHHTALHPSKLGKVATAAQWIVLLGYIAASIVGELPTFVAASLHMLLLGAVFAGMIATYGYAEHIGRISRSRR